MRQAEWAQHLVAVVAGEIRRYRGERRMSAQKLADRCSDLGYEVPRSVIANLENGRRDSISVAQLNVLAAALEVSPALLLAPAGRVDSVEILPDVVVDPHDALQWIKGNHDLGGAGPLHDEERDIMRISDMHRFYVDDTRSKVRLAAALQERADVATEHTADGYLPVEEQRNVVRELDAAQQKAAITTHHLAQYRQGLRRRGIAPPPLPADLTDAVQEAENGDPMDLDPWTQRT